jgi:diguanylate cyclase (GGDEF)-like protein
VITSRPVDGPGHTPPSPSPLLMARAARVMYGGGAVLCVVGLALPHTQLANVTGFWAIAAAAIVATGLVSFRPERRPLWFFQALTALSTVTIALTVYFSAEGHGARGADTEMLFLWPALYSAYFFSRTATAAQVGLIGVAYASVLAVSNAGVVGWTRWTVTLGMVLASAFLVSMLSGRVDRLIAELREAARTDALTGLLNRRGFEARFAAELSRANRTERPVGLLVGDLDHFKHLNDLLGHPAGDQALRRVAAILDDGTRAMDAAARIGGEELALIIPEEDADTAVALAERLRREIERSFAGDPFPLTISFGIASFPGSGDESGELMRAADAALYAAKDRGRNRSVLFDDRIDVNVSSQLSEGIDSQ